VSEIDVMNVDAYTKEYVALARASITKTGGKLLAASQNGTSLEGAPQKSCVTSNVYDSLEKAQASRNSSDYKEARKVGGKYASANAWAGDIITIVGFCCAMAKRLLLTLPSAC
jgi:uncharacterized protein (DUF1330 family)